MSAFTASTASAGGDISLDSNDTTTVLNYYGDPAYGGTNPGTDPNAWAGEGETTPPYDDTWNLYVDTPLPVCEALVRIEWKDWYYTGDVYQLYVDDVLKGTNPPGGSPFNPGNTNKPDPGQVDVWLGAGDHEVVVNWIFFQASNSPIPGGSHYDITFEVLEQRCGVDIDIKPGSDPNCINPDGHGVIPVAILTTDDFDASTVNPFTVTLEGSEVRVKGKSGNAGSLEDVDGDGDLDLVVQITDDGTLEPGQATATLSALTYDGIEVTGSDDLCIVPPSS